jgi:hypothetical protein
MEVIMSELVCLGFGVVIGFIAGAIIFCPNYAENKEVEDKAVAAYKERLINRECILAHGEREPTTNMMCIVDGKIFPIVVPE